MKVPDLPPAADYPAAPWRTSGGAWIGLFRIDQPLALPADLTPLPGPRWLVVALIRHLRGTLRYNELIVGAYVRRGPLPGLHVQHIWVDSAASLWGGRELWGLPKALAYFDWQGATVEIADADGPIATLSVDPRTAWLPRVPLLVPLFGERDHQRAWALVLASARLGRAGLRINVWSARFPYRAGPTPLLAVALKPFWITVPAPRII